MGLPLFIAPIDSDIPSKDSIKCPANAAHGRSPIRRDSPVSRQRRRQLHQAREHRLRLLATLQGEEEPLLPTTTTASRPRTGAEWLGLDADAVDAASRARLDRRVLRESDFQRILQGVQSSQAAEERSSRSLSGDSARRYAEGRYPEWAMFSRNSPRTYAAWHREQFSGSDGIDPDFHHPSQANDRVVSSASPNYMPPPRELREATAGPRAISRGASEERLRFRRSIQPPIYARQYSRVRRSLPRLGRWDGLGDRDRSLSPEGDNVWDTLQSTLTPDPQPPSAGSSFASSSASTAASQRTTAISSANTSMTSSNELIEPPCDPVADDSEQEESGDETLDQILGRRLAGSERPSMTRPRRRSYADVAADESLDTAPAGDASPDWLTGMHHIVRGLATREDIPDEWWQEAGLSRSMREDSN